MRFFYISGRRYIATSILVYLFLLGPHSVLGQQLKITDFSVFGGLGGCPTGPGLIPPSSPGCGVYVGVGSDVLGGSVGSYSTVFANNNASIVGNIFSAGNVQLSNTDTVTGRITAANLSALTGTIFSAGTNSLLKGNIDINGKIVISSGIVSGVVTHPAAFTYSGPTPAGGNLSVLAALPTMPVMPPITSFPAVGTTNITNSATITPGSYGAITLAAGKTLTFSGSRRICLQKH